MATKYISFEVDHPFRKMCKVCLCIEEQKPISKVYLLYQFFEHDACIKPVSLRTDCLHTHIRTYAHTYTNKLYFHSHTNYMYSHTNSRIKYIH